MCFLVPIGERIQPQVIIPEEWFKLAVLPTVRIDIVFHCLFGFECLLYDFIAEELSFPIYTMWCYFIRF